MCATLDAILPESLRKRVCAISERISRVQSTSAKAVVAMLVESAVERVEPLLSAVEDSSDVRAKRAAALRAALDDAGWKPSALKSALGHKSPSSVSRYLSGEEAIPDRIYALPELGPAFHKRVGQLFGIKQESA